jgi:RNA polymerase II-associated factor 1
VLSCVHLQNGNGDDSAPPPPPPPPPATPAAAAKPAAAPALPAPATAATEAAAAVPPPPPPPRDEAKDREREERRRKEKAHAAAKEKEKRKAAQHREAQEKAKKDRKKWQKDSEFLCQLQFRNTLPDPPLGPHFLKIPLNVEKAVQYAPTSLETEHKWKLHCNRDLGVDIDIIDARSYTVPAQPVPLHPADAELLNWDPKRELVGKPKSSANGTGEPLSRQERRRAIDTQVTWLKKTSYLTNDPGGAVHKFKSEQQSQKEKNARLANDLAAKRLRDPVNAVERSFAEANMKKKTKLQHSTKQGVEAEWVIPVLPDTILWGNQYTHVQFDVDPLKEQNLITGQTRRELAESNSIIANTKQVTKHDGEVIHASSFMVPRSVDAAANTTATTGGDSGGATASTGADAGYAWVKDYQVSLVQCICK